MKYERPSQKHMNSSLEHPAKAAKPILILDDDRLSRQLLVRVVKRMGHTPIATAQGTDALSTYEERNEDIALIISDMLMPGMSGERFSEKVFADYPNARILFISGLPREEFEEILAIENVAFLQKPFKPQDLMRAIEDHMP